MLTNVIVIFILIFIILIFSVIMIGFTNLHIYGKESGNQIRVSCVGDSITYGHMVYGWYWRNYPAVLGRLLGHEYQVENFGVSARTLQDDGDYPYCETKEYTKSKNFLPNIVVIKLGTNDAKVYNWKSKDDYKKKYNELIEEYRSLSSKPKIFLCTVASAFPDDCKELPYDMMHDNLYEISQAVEEVAKENHLSVIDIQTATKGHPDWFNKDGIHPNAKGAREIAAVVAAAINP